MFVHTPLLLQRVKIGRIKGGDPVPQGVQMRSCYYRQCIDLYIAEMFDGGVRGLNAIAELTTAGETLAVEDNPAGITGRESFGHGVVPAPEKWQD
ncbi:MAG: hypothetical protein WDZ52_04975 [Pseudohongiellaceae bacterium]